MAMWSFLKAEVALSLRKEAAAGLRGTNAHL